MIVDYENLKVEKEGIDFFPILSKWAESYAKQYSNPDFSWTMKETDFAEDVFNILDFVIHIPTSDVFKKKVYNEILITALTLVATQGMLESEKNAQYGGASISIATMLGDIYAQCLDDPEISSWKKFLDKYKRQKKNPSKSELDSQDNNSKERKMDEFNDFIAKEVKNYSHARQERLKGNVMYQAEREGLPAGAQRGQYGSFSSKGGTKGTEAPYSVPLYSRANGIIAYFNYLHWNKNTKWETEYRKKAFYALAEKSGCNYTKEYLDQIHARLIERNHDSQLGIYYNNKKRSQIDIDILRLFISEAFYLSPYTTLEQYIIQQRNLCGFFSSNNWQSITDAGVIIDRNSVALKRSTEKIEGSGKFNGEDVYFEAKLSIKGDSLKITGGKIRFGKKTERFEYNIPIRGIEQEEKSDLSDTIMRVRNYIQIEKNVFRFELQMRVLRNKYCIKVLLLGDPAACTVPPVFLTADTDDENRLSCNIPLFVWQYETGVRCLTYFLHKFFAYRKAKTSWHEVLLALNCIELPKREFEEIPWKINYGVGTFGHYGQTDR